MPFPIIHVCGLRLFVRTCVKVIVLKHEKEEERSNFNCESHAKENNVTNVNPNQNEFHGKTKIKQWRK